MKSAIGADQRVAIGRISGLVLINAMIFQETLARSNPRVQTLQKIIDKESIQREFCSHWNMIVSDINYYSIFHIAYEVLANIPTSANIVASLRKMAETAQDIISMRAALRHDLMGRIYHRLLVEKKYLGTFYTSIPAAILLLKLSLRQDSWKIKWDNLEEIRNFKLADLACGTGTLLMAAADCITDNYVSRSATLGKPLDIPEIQKILTEQTIFGYDVLPSAIHLTASTLALRAPEVHFSRTNLFSLPLGGQHTRLGSLEYLFGKEVGIPQDLFGAGTEARRIKESGESIEHLAPLPDLDLCVMNPPFTRSVGGNLLFGSLPASERSAAQTRLKKLVKDKGAFANITAGLGSVFVATADPHIKEGGKIALVLPKAVLSGVAWQKTRELIRKKYQMDYVITSHDPQKWNFSESTSLSEALLIATKVEFNHINTDHRTTFVNLSHNPTTAFEALAIYQQLKSNHAPDLADGQGALNIHLGGQKLGEAVSLPWSQLRQMSEWILPCAFAHIELTRFAKGLLNGQFKLPGQPKVRKIPICRMGEIIELGPDRRDIHDGFSQSKAHTAFPAIWGHDSSEFYQIMQNPNSYLAPLHRASKGRHLRKTEHLWPRAGRLLLAERLRLNTHRVAMFRCNVKVLSNVWWPGKLIIRGKSTELEKALCIWQNSSLGIISLLSVREETEGAWVDFKKPILENLPVLDVSNLTDRQLNILADAFDELSHEPLLSFAEIGHDAVRHRFDTAISKAFGLGSFSPIRDLLALEPILTLKRL